MPEGKLLPMTAAYTEYLRDESRTVGQAEHIAFPENAREVADILAAAQSAGTRVTVQGARTGLAAAATPQGGTVLNLMKMDVVLGMAQDADGRFRLRVQPGVVLAKLRKMLEDRHFDTTDWDDTARAAYKAFRKAPAQFLPTDPTEASATIGGMVACNASGARSYLYGSVRRHVLAVRVLLPEGDSLLLRRGDVRANGRHLTLTTDSGRVLELALPSYQMPATKNASGYYIEDNMDAVDLFIGSDGTLGVITEVELALSAAPATVWGATCFFSAEEQALDFTIALRENRREVAAIEFFDAGALAILRRQKAENPAFSQLPDIPEHFTTAIYLELHCADRTEAAEALFAVGTLMEEAGGHEQDSWVARTDFDKDTLVFFRHAVPESVNMMIDERKKQHPAITKLGTDMAVPGTRLKEAMAMYHSQLAEAGLEYAIWGHIGDNHLHVNIIPRNDADYAAGKALYTRWAQAVSGWGGSVSAEHGVGKLKADYLRVMYGDEAICQMAALKRQLDPKGILGVGNLFPPMEGGAPA